MLSPELNQVILDRATRGAVVIETAYTTIYAEGSSVEESSLEQIFQISAVKTVLRLQCCGGWCFFLSS